MKELRIIFLGTSDFAVASLDILIKNNYNVVGVVTAPDKPSGRGQKLHASPVKEYAVKNNIKTLQSIKLKDPIFLKELKGLEADLQIIVAFRMLPESVWAMPSKGTFNLHASLLPQYRGAAPINWAIINGEKQTGVTTFFLQQEIDTGDILFQEAVAIEENDNAGDLHDKLMLKGAELVLKTVDAIQQNIIHTKKQDDFLISELKPAPKIFKETCRINWNNKVNMVYNFIRGLSPYPAAFTELVSDNSEKLGLKIFKTKKEIAGHLLKPGEVISDEISILKIAVNNGFIHLMELQLEGKKRLNVEEFLRGFPIKKWKINA